MKLVMCIIAAEAMTQLTCKAEIFNRLRNWIKSLSTFTNDLLSCPYCVSVWVAAFTVVLLMAWEWSWGFVLLLAIHRISNVLHDLFSIILNFKIDQILRR
jgi:uncharacterized membrane protein